MIANMSLKNLVHQLFPEKFEDHFISIYESVDEAVSISAPDFADEILETHGDLIVTDYAFSRHGILVVRFKEEQTC